MESDNLLNDFNNRLKKLKTADSSEVYKILCYVRSSFGKDSLGACKGLVNALKNNDDALKDIINLLKKVNERVIDVSLSILGCCCFKDFATCKKLADLGVIPPLVTVLRCLGRDCIQCRVCRLVGNLAEDYSVARKLHDLGIVPALLPLLTSDSKKSTDTLMMCIRAIRCVWRVRESQEEMLTMGTVKTIAGFLSPAVLERQDGVKLIKCVLKVIVVVLNDRPQACANQMDASGHGFEHLVMLAKQKSLRELVLRCVKALCLVASCRPSMGNAGFVTLIINEVPLAESESTKQWLLASLGAFCFEGVNRAKVRLDGGLPLLLASLRGCSVRDAGTALHVLLQFLYDDQSLELLAEEGLVPALVDKLEAFTELESSGHGAPDPDPDFGSRRNKRKREGLYGCAFWDDFEQFSGFPMKDEVPGNVKYRMGSASPDDSYTRGNIDDFCWSPTSPSTSSISPCASPPLLEDSFRSDDSSSLEYSPVVSDSDNEETPKGKVAEKQSLQDKCGVYCVLTLLEKICCLKSARIVNQRAIAALLDYVSRVTNPNKRSVCILVRVIGNRQNFAQLMSQQFVLLLLSHLGESAHEDCVRCSRNISLFELLLQKFRNVSQSNFGFGTMEHLILQGDMDVKRAVVIAFPFVASYEPALLQKFLISRPGLKLLMEAVQGSEGDDLISRFAAESVSYLAISLNIPKITDYVKKSKNTSEEENKPAVLVPESAQPVDDVVVLKLDDGSELTTSRSLLACHSDMFRTMFSGSFSESTQNHVHLPGVSRRCAETVLSSMRDADWLDRLATCGVEDGLEVLEAMDRFLMPGSWHVARHLGRLLCPGNLLAVFRRSATSLHVPQFRLLGRLAVRYLLTQRMRPCQRREVFLGAARHGCSAQLAESVAAAIADRVSCPCMVFPSVSFLIPCSRCSVEYLQAPCHVVPSGGSESTPQYE
ncbi:armadillo repeat-containing protein 5 [Bacillus rossius redtenbacheri]|uniref:armadillo repeat-containing protein 5 n=1 Tax=Bacillus rossius redtenbacheri TaxID=93214 RepID=UPI002FDCFC2B